MKALMLAAVCAFALISSLPESLRAQDPSTDRAPSMSPDDKAAQILAEKKKGIVFIDAAVGPGRCGLIGIGIGRNVDDKLQTIAVISGSGWFFSVRSGFSSPTALPPGEYVVRSVECVDGNRHATYNGPFAAFHLGAGEFVDLGVLNLEAKAEGLFVQTGTLRKSVERSSPDALKDLKTKLPHNFARMISRPMTLIGPSETAIKSCGALPCPK